MKITFIETQNFRKKWEKLKLTEEDLLRLKAELQQAPDRWPEIQGTGGVRKMRFAINGRGKRGGARVIYVHFLLHEVIALLGVYSKKKQQEITPEEHKWLELCRIH